MGSGNGTRVDNEGIILKGILDKKEKNKKIKHTIYDYDKKYRIYLGIKDNGVPNTSIEEFALKRSMRKENISWEERRRICQFWLRNKTKVDIALIFGVFTLAISPVVLVSIYNKNNQEDYDLEQEAEVKDTFYKEIESGKYTKDELIQMRNDITLYLEQDEPKVKIK